VYIVAFMPTRREFIAGLAAGPLLSPYAAPAELPGSILSKPRLGAEFFLNNGETRDGVFQYLRRMAESGLTIARIFTIWDQIEREEGKWDYWGYDWIYDAAAQNGILVANTLCSEDPPGWMGTAPFYHQWADLSNPRLRPYSEIYIEKVVNRYKNHPAHGVWLLQNEPGLSGGAEPYVLAEFARWLQAKYGTLDSFNKARYKRLRRFEDAQVPQSGGWSDYPASLDWRRFSCDHLADQLRWIHSQVDRYHPGALTHGNPPGLLGNMPGSGRDLWRIKPTVHFLGTSIHPSHMFGMFGREDFGMAYGLCCDVLRSASAPAPWWVTELQGGPTMFSGSRHLNPAGTEITRWLWDGLGNGARGIVFWLWHPRTEGLEAGEWGLAGPNGEPTERTRATQAVARVLRQHEDFFTSAKPLPARAAILYDRDAMLLYTVDHASGAAAGRGGGQPVDEIMHPLIGCYKALHRAHVPADFLDISELEAGAAGRYRVLYLPNCYALSAKSVAAIREFVRAGGTLWADGLVAWKDEQGATRQFPPGPLSDVFGFTVEDIQAVWEPFALAGQGDAAGELWRCLIPAGSARALLTGPGGRPTAVEHAFGKGRALYYGSAVTLGYLHRGEPRVGRWIAAPALEASRDLPIRLTEGSGLVSFRAMQAQGRSSAVLNNWGAAARVTVQFPAATQSVVEILSGAVVPLRRAGAVVEAAIELQEAGSAVLLSR
jgi:beta-galactosidase